MNYTTTDYEGAIKDAKNLLACAKEAVEDSKEISSTRYNANRVAAAARLIILLCDHYVTAREIEAETNANAAAAETAETETTIF